MRREGLNLGGEQSGHIVFLDHNTTGDGILTALQVLALMRRKRSTLSELADVMESLPQVLRAVRVREKPPLEQLSGVETLLDEIKAQLADSGRILVRYSGTEPVARVMLEGEDQKQLEDFAQRVCAEIDAAIGEGNP